MQSPLVHGFIPCAVFHHFLIHPHLANFFHLCKLGTTSLFERAHTQPGYIRPAKHYSPLVRCHRRYLILFPFARPSQLPYITLPRALRPRHPPSPHYLTCTCQSTRTFRLSSCWSPQSIQSWSLPFHPPLFSSRRISVAWLVFPSTRLSNIPGTIAIGCGEGHRAQSRTIAPSRETQWESRNLGS